MRPHDIDGLAAGQSGKRPDVSSKGSFVARPRTRSRGQFLPLATGSFLASHLAMFGPAQLEAALFAAGPAARIRAEARW